MNSGHRTDTDSSPKAPPACPGPDLPVALRDLGRCGRTDWQWFFAPDWERHEPTEYERAWEAARENHRRFCSQLVSRALPCTYGDRNGEQWQLGRAPKRCDGIIMHGVREGEGIDTEPLECDECGTRYDLGEYWDESALCPRHGFRLGWLRSGPDNSPRVCHQCEREKPGTTEVAVGGSQVTGRHAWR